MNRIDKLFAKLKKEKRKALIVYITAGYPGLKATERLIHTLHEAGADLVEIGIPFSDPLADGPTIQKASYEALLKGTSTAGVLRMVSMARKRSELPLVFMTYYNIILHYGPEKFIRDSKRSGADGVIVPDLPPEEAGGLIAAAKRHRFSLIFLAAPTSDKGRLKRIAGAGSGFIYYVSLTGVTGARKKLPSDITSHVKTLKSITKKPVCVGFGISTPDQAGSVARIADGVIVGSAVIKSIEKNKGKRDMYKKVGSFVKSLSKAVHKNA